METAPNASDTLTNNNPDPSPGDTSTQPNPSPDPAPSGGGEPNPNAWLEGMSEAHKALIQEKQFKDPSALVESYVNLQKHLGVEPDKRLVMPDPDNAEQVNAFYAKLGKPEKAEDYKVPEGTDEALGTWAKETFHKLHLTDAQAEALMTEFNQYSQNLMSGQQEQMEQRFAQEKTELEREWGAAYQQSLGVAKRAVQRFGIDAEQITGIERALGYKQTMNFFKKIGEGLGEAAFASSEFGDGTSSGTGARTPAQAQAEIQSLKSDKQFAKKLSEGDVAARRKWDQLHVWAYASQG